jgi:hypothetical protein
MKLHWQYGIDGITYVRCRICGDHRRVISGRHLSKHETDRETYMEQYLLSPDQLIANEFRLIQSSRKGYAPLGKKDWLTALKTIHKKSGNIFAGHLQKKYPYIYLQGVWIYGSWDKALSAAGFSPRTMRKRNRWDRNSIIRQLQAMHKKCLPLYAKHVMENNSCLFSSAIHEFGSWPNALVQAGVNNQPREKRLYNSRWSLLNQLGDALFDRPKSGIPDALKLEAEHYFGSLDNAIAVLRKGKNLPGWNRPKVIAALSELHRSKKNLAYATMRRDNVALLSAGEKHFGSWGKALYAAGIDPSLYFAHHTWRKRD